MWIVPGAGAGAGDAAMVVALLTWRSAGVRRVRRALAEGASVFRDPRRFVARVLPWQIGNRTMRIGSTWCFLHAAGLPSGIAVVLAVSTVQGSASAVPLPGANFAAGTAALLLAVPMAAGHSVDAGAVAALLIVQPVSLTGLIGSLVLSCALLEVRTARSLLAATARVRAQSGPPEAVARAA